jgi:hypothetical protein
MEVDELIIKLTVMESTAQIPIVTWPDGTKGYEHAPKRVLLATIVKGPVSSGVSPDHVPDEIIEWLRTHLNAESAPSGATELRNELTCPTIR